MVIVSFNLIIIIGEFFVIESICILWFSIELVMRFYSAPSRLKFAKQFGNIIDFLSILPYFMETTDTSAKFSFLRIIRLVRVFRIFKLARHFKGLQILAHTLRASLNELMLLMFFLIIGVVLFSSIVYYSELDEAKSFLKGSQMLALDTSSKLAQALLQYQLDKLPIDYIEKRNALVDAVTLEDAKRASKRLWGQGLLTVIVGRTPQASAQPAAGPLKAN